jgi:Lipid A 3-O-deacylase (PagL)
MKAVCRRFTNWQASTGWDRPVLNRHGESGLIFWDTALGRIVFGCPDLNELSLFFPALKSLIYCRSRIMRRYGLVFCCLLYLMLLGESTSAGVCGTKVAADSPRHQFEFTAGYSPASTALIGTATDRRLVLAGFNYGYLCWDWHAVSVNYTAGMLPAVVVLQPTQFAPVSRIAGQLVPAHSVYGFGVLPIGFVAEFGRTTKVHPYAEIAGGFVASVEPIPVNDLNATGLNFLFYFGSGARWNISQATSIDAGYRFQHISNAGTTDFNPGLDDNVFYIGYSMRR